MAYNNDYNYAAIDYIKQPSYYELMRSSAVLLLPLRLFLGFRIVKPQQHLLEAVNYKV